MFIKFETCWFFYVPKFINVQYYPVYVHIFSSFTILPHLGTLFPSLCTMFSNLCTIFPSLCTGFQSLCTMFRVFVHKVMYLYCRSDQAPSFSSIARVQHVGPLGQNCNPKPKQTKWKQDFWSNYFTLQIFKLDISNLTLS